MDIINGDRIKGFNKPFHKLSVLNLNDIPRGNASQIRLWIRNIEASVIADTPKNNPFIFTILPFLWECTHNMEPEDDPVLGIPGNLEELGEMITDEKFTGNILGEILYNPEAIASRKLTVKVEEGEESESCDNLKAEFVKFFTGGRSTSRIAVFFKEEASQVRDVLRLAIRTIMTFGPSSLRKQFTRGVIKNWSQYKNSLLELKGCKTEQPSIVDARAIIRDAGRMNTVTVESRIIALRERMHPFFKKI